MSTAFLNAPLNLDYPIIVWAPRVFAEAQVTDYDEAWLVKKALYGLRESPKAWGDYRDCVLAKIRIMSWS